MTYRHVMWKMCELTAKNEKKNSEPARLLKIVNTHPSSSLVQGIDYRHRGSCY